MYDEKELIVKLRDALQRVADLERKEFAAGGPGAGLTFENGLTRLADVIRLGGLLTGHTIIDGDGLYDLTIRDIASLLYLESDGDITLDSHGGITLDSNERVALISGAGDVIIRSDAAGQVVRLLTQAITRLFADDEGNVVVGPSVGDGELDTAATDGFFFIPSMNGPPSSVPTDYDGRVPMVYNRAANELMIYNPDDAGWYYVSLSS